MKLYFFKLYVLYFLKIWSLLNQQHYLILLFRGEFSYAKLEDKRNNSPGCFILRESEVKYNVYYLDVCTEER